MTLFFNLVFLFVSILFFAGRLYEVMFILEEGTYFLTQPGIVTTPLMLAIAFLIAICCGVLIFSDKKQTKRSLKIPVGVFGFAAAILFIGSSVLNLIRIFTVTGGFLGYDIMMILASLGLIIYGIIGIRGSNKEKLPMLLTILFPVALCMNSVILDVQPISNTYFLYRSLAGITNLAFFTLLFKNAYAPSKSSRPMLYIASIINYLISAASMIAGITGGVINSYIDKADILLYAGLAVMGIYSLFVSFYIMPSKAKTAVRQMEENEEWEYEEEQDDVKEYSSVYSSAKPLTNYESESVYENTAFAADTDFRQASKISENTIALLFAQKDSREGQAEETTAQESIAENVATQTIDSQATRRIEPVKPDKKQAVQKTEKSVFRGTAGKKTATTKTVYKAPKK